MHILNTLVKPKAPHHVWQCCLKLFYILENLDWLKMQFLDWIKVFLQIYKFGRPYKFNSTKMHLGKTLQNYCFHTFGPPVAGSNTVSVKNIVKMMVWGKYVLSRF